MRAPMLLLSLLLVLLLAPMLVSAVHHERRIHLQNRVLNPLDDAPARVLRTDGAPAEYLVQLQPPITAGTIHDVETSIPISFAENVHIPYHSFLAVANHDQVLRLEAHPQVLWVGDFLPSYKYPSALKTWQATALAGAKSAELVIALHSTASAKAAEQLVKSWVFSIKNDLGVEMRLLGVAKVDRAHVKVPANKFMDVVQWLSRQVGSLWIEPALEMRSFANKATGIVEDGVAGHSSIIEANGINGGGSNFEIVSLADTGLDWGNCFFNMTAAPTSAFVPQDKVVVYNQDGGDATDATGHGTAMAALIAGDPAGTESNYRGLAPKARIAFTDISTGTSGTYTGPVDIIDWMSKARTNYSSQIVVGAFGSTTPVTWYTTRDVDVDNFLYLYRSSFIAIFAAGNFGQTSGTTNLPGVQLASPATAKNVISVGASQNELQSVIDAATATSDTALSASIAADNSQYGADVLAPFSSKGPAFDGRFKPDVVAPGMGIFGASATAACDVNAVEGTSFAAALVGGAAVLVRQYLRNGYKGTGAPLASDEIQPSAALVKAALINSGVGLSGYSAAEGKFFGTDGQVPHTAYGFGRVQLSNVLYLTNPALGALSLWQDSTAGVRQGETQRICFDVTDGTKDLKVTLVWTDPGGSIVAGFVLTNNLDLLVMDPNGRAYFSNGLTNFDSINNVEQVTVQNPTLGNWVAYIHGLTISAVTPNGQVYAVVVSGNVTTASSGCPNRCPHACNGQGTCSEGICQCSTGRFGVDCSLTACPNNCTAVDGSANGICNSITNECDCAAAFGGADCRLPANATVVTVVKGKKGLSNGAIAGIAVGTFFAGAILCGALGFVVAIQYLIWKRKSHKKLIEDGKKNAGSGL